MTKARSNATANAAKGDLTVGNGTNLSGVLAVGNTGDTIVADSSTATGLAYSKNAPLAGLTAINPGGTALTGASTITISGISNKSRLQIIVFDASSANASSIIGLRFNSDSTSGRYIYGGSYVTNGNAIATAFNLSADQTFLGKMGNSAANVLSAIVHISGTFGAGLCQITQGVSGNGTNVEAYQWQGSYDAQAQITSVSIVSSTGNFDNGSIYIFGA